MIFSNKKGLNNLLMYGSLFFIIISVIFYFTLVSSINSLEKNYGNLDQIGSRQLNIIHVASQANKDLSFLDQVGRYTLQDALYNISKGAFIEDSKCGWYNNKVLMNNISDDCFAGFNFDIQKILSDEMKSMISGYLDIYSMESTPDIIDASNYEFYFKQSNLLKVIGVNNKNLVYNLDKPSITTQYYNDKIPAFGSVDDIKVELEVTVETNYDYTANVDNYEISHPNSWTNDVVKEKKENGWYDTPEKIVSFAHQYVGVSYGGSGRPTPEEAHARERGLQCGSFVGAVFVHSIGKDIGANGNKICESANINNHDGQLISSNLLSQSIANKNAIVQPGDVYSINYLPGKASSTGGAKYGHTGIIVGVGTVNGVVSGYENRAGYVHANFNPDPNGEIIIIHSVNPVGYTKLSHYNEKAEWIKICRFI